MFNKKLLLEKDKRIASLESEVTYLRSKLDSFLMPANVQDKREENMLLEGALTEIREFSAEDIKNMQEAEKEASQMFMGELIEVG